MRFSFQVVLKPQLINGPHHAVPPGRSVDDENPFHHQQKGHLLFGLVGFIGKETEERLFKGADHPHSSLFKTSARVIEFSMLAVCL